MATLKRLCVPLVLVAIALWIGYESAAGLEEVLIWFLSWGFALLWLTTWLVWEIWASSTRPQKRVLCRITFAFAALFVASVFVWHWPLRLAFAIWRQPLEALYSRVKMGERIQTPIRIGTFTIHRAETLYDSYPALILDTNPTGPTCFIRSPEVPGMAQSAILLQDDWILFAED